MVRRLNCFLDLWRDKHSYTFQQTRASEFKAPDMGTLTEKMKGEKICMLWMLTEKMKGEKICMLWMLTEKMKSKKICMLWMVTEKMRSKKICMLWMLTAMKPPTLICSCCGNCVRKTISAKKGRS